MARIHGRRGRVYLDVPGTGTATPLPFIASWSLSMATDTEEVTALEDGTKVYVAGLPDASGEFGGFYDDTTPQTYTAATDGNARKFYLYPNVATTGQYFFGTIIVDFRVNAAVSSAAQLSAQWKAATPINKIG
jgi:hypothetical protein